MQYHMLMPTHGSVHWVSEYHILYLFPLTMIKTLGCEFQNLAAS